MKKKLLLSVCLLSGISFGQSFTAANEYAIGASQKMYLIDSAASNYASTVGSGVTWDYSTYGFTPNGTRLDTIFANANTTDFPTSNKINSIQNVLTTYLETSASGRSVAGIEYVTGNAVFGTIKMMFNTDRLDFMTYDFALNDQISDIFNGTVQSNAGVNPASGNSFSKFDGIGTLKLSPTVTKTNVIRHHLIDTINTSVVVFTTVPVQIILDQYDYYDLTGNNLPLLTYVNVKLIQNGTTQLSDLNFVLNTVLPTNQAAIAENSKSTFTLSPNPATDELTLSGDFDGQEKISITDLSGKEMNFTFSENKINVSKLNAGVYFVNIEKDGNVSQEKFVKK
ncbi:MAG: T9SS type A sorting domain-containing protein [Bacteroidota bacterium]